MSKNSSKSLYRGKKFRTSPCSYENRIFEVWFKTSFVPAALRMILILGFFSGTYPSLHAQDCSVNAVVPANFCQDMPMHQVLKAGLQSKSLIKAN